MSPPLPSSLVAQANTVPPCATGSTSFTCKLQGILHVLSATAAVLAVFLVLTVLLAVWIYRRSRDSDPLP